MSEYDWDYQDDDEQPIDPRSLPKQLRDMLKAAKKAEKEALDRVKTLEEQNREIVVSKVLESKGVPKKVAKLIPSDITSDEAVEKWLTDYSDVFTPSSPATAQQAQEATNEKPVTNSGQAFIENAASQAQSPDAIAMQRMSESASTAQPFGGQYDQIMAKLNDPNLTKEEFDALLKKGGL